MRILFTPSGTGLGHVGRCIPIAKRLEKNGAQILFSTYREGLKYVQKEGFQTVEAPDIGVQVKPNGSIDFRLTTVNPGPFLTVYTIMKQIDSEINFMQTFKPDVVVSDSRASSLVAAKILDIPRICILNQFQVFIPRRNRFLKLARIADATTLTLVGRVWTDVLQVLIPDFPQPYTLSTRNLNIPKTYHKKTKFIGPIIPLTPNDLPDKIQLRKKLGLSEEKIIIFAPISGPAKERAYFTGLLRQILSKFEANYQIVMSLGYPKSSKEPVNSENLIVHGWIPNRFEYLKACDIVVSRGGHGTLSQSIFYGKPIILIPTPSHTEQINNAKKAVELGIAQLIFQKDLNKESLLKATQKLLKNQIKENSEQLQKEVIQWNGLETAVKIISNIK
ncbi:UDP-N-acetylglucosamine--N-acetylmuramyl-(pentapeptide) pyrophosphoryl-undecaprenol N-acetylglucosamine transferase [Candidatus Bathyarchaeota archaeon]|nr:UDP-N-acetylglucosamine--N-acetylmuramyl-(pentapeptide) pyrophosphoryl-undecaprenol N-acetylglucosamine transferase [Candidatus Bathyarchaeota archaeon]